MVNEQSVSVRKVKKKSGKPKSNVRYLPSKLYIVNHVPSREEVKKERERHTDAWAVRGHPRHYKSGKVIWIKPYVKGEKDGVRPKEYRVSEFDNKDDRGDFKNETTE